VEAFGQAYAPTFAQLLIFILMAVIILVRPAGLLGRKEATA
jgi:branched-chain amino acid transport system permease protein